MGPIKSVYFSEEITETRAKTSKAVLGSSLDKDVFRDNFSVMLSDTYRMTRIVVSFGGVSIGKICEHLSEFSSSNTVGTLIVLQQNKSVDSS
jgi:hypothetical protein